MPLATGQTLSFYEILGPLGAGAMGEVYRARDTRLERDVAIKVLPEELADDVERLRRFEREAKTLASLNHPNLAGIHGVDQEGKTYFLALELVRGADLAERVAKGPLRMNEALDVCRQIAEGLEAAHESGVVHRDLKPANVRVTPEGVVKILDFGLAKPLQPLGEGDSILTTEEGLLMGTPTYMSPEQARGKPVDRRTDVWAFGCVLYECLTGARAFGGGNVPDILAAVLERGWDRSRLPAETPAHVRELLERCLDKDPRQRLRDIGEARILLERAPGARREEQASPRWRGGPRTTGALVVIVLGVGALVGRFGFSPTPPSAPPAAPVIRLQRLTGMVGMEEMPAVSPNGEIVAFVSRVNGKRQVFQRLLETGTWRQLTTDEEADHSFPRWVDDTRLIYFVHPKKPGDLGSLWEMDILGSSDPRPLLRGAQGEADVDSDGERIAMFRLDAEGQGLVLLDFDGGGSEIVHRLPPESYFSPRWSPDGTQVAFEARLSLNQNEIRVMDATSGELVFVLELTGQTRGLAWLPGNSGLVYASSKGSTLAYPPTFSLRTVDLEDARDVPLPCEDGGYASYVEPDVTREGRLVASRVAMKSDIFRYPVGKAPLENVENELRITHQTGQVQVPSASPNGDEVAYLSDSGGRGNIWVAKVEVEGPQSPRRLTDEQDPDTLIGLPLWSPDGKWITYWRGPPNSSAEQWLVRPDGSDRHKLVDVWGGASWSPDGEWLYYMQPRDETGRWSTDRISIETRQTEHVRNDAGGMDVTSDGSTAYFLPGDLRQGEVYVVSPVKTGTPRRLVEENLGPRIPLWPHQYTLSRDGLWLACPLRDEGTTNLWRISTTDGQLYPVTDFQQRATTIGRQVSWSRDGKYIFAAVMESDADIVLLEDALQ